MTVSIRSVSFARSSSAPVTRGRPVRERAEQRDERQLVDEARHLRRARSVVATSGVAAHLDIADQLAADRRRLKTRDARAHPVEHVEEAGARAG